MYGTSIEFAFARMLISSIIICLFRLGKTYKFLFCGLRGVIHEAVDEFLLPFLMKKVASLVFTQRD